MGNAGEFGSRGVWGQPHTRALAGHNLFTSQRRSAGRCSRGASAPSREASPRRTVPSPLRAACLPPAFPSSLAGCRFGCWFVGFFFVGGGEELGSGSAFAQLRAPVTLIVTSVPRDKNLIGELGKARCQQVTPPRSGFKSAFKGPRCNCAASRPETMRRSRGESQLARVLLFSSY